VRPHVNRIVLLVTLSVALPAIAAVERVRPGAARPLAILVIRFVARACGIRFDVHGRDRLVDGVSYVLVPNHTSPVDIPALLLARPEARFVAAAELFRVPLLGTVMRALGTVPITREDRRAAHRQIVELSRPVADRELVIFPEGGIGPAGGPQRFKSGAFLVAIDSRAPVVPVAVRGAASVLPANGRLKVRPGVVRVEILGPIATAGMTRMGRRGLAEAAWTEVHAALRA
jgi:1-acyl-sn-glycerol-3-phosphate acyltransferase